MEKWKKIEGFDGYFVSNNREYKGYVWKYSLK